MNRFVFVIDDSTAGIRLDKALSLHSSIDSRSQATSLIDRGFVKRNGEAVKPAHKTVLGETFLVEIPSPEKANLEPLDLKLDIIYEDADLLVVNKPAGLVVHPAFGHAQDTLVNALLHHSNQFSSNFSNERPGIVHRIDKDTSGLLVVAKNETVLRGLAKQFKKKTVHRIYWALVYGHFKEKSGTITTYIRRHPTDRKKFASEQMSGLAEPKGKLAVTHYAVKAEHPSGLSLIHCQLETGRTHQIRVHLSELGHPILSDPFYCNSHRVKSLKSVHLRNQTSQLPHLMLHAAELGFVHPGTKKTMRFAVDWPSEIIAYIKDVGFYAPTK